MSAGSPAGGRRPQQFCSPYALRRAAAPAQRRLARLIRGDEQTTHRPVIVAAGLAASLIAGCAQMQPPAGGAAASAHLAPTAGNSVAGTVRLQQVGSKVVVTAQISGLKPNAEHGFHVHEKGDCSAPDATSAGGHFNPGGKPDAHFGKAERHSGDLPNLQADGRGRANYRWESELLTFGSGAANVIGRSVVIHRDPDDYGSQPAGNSGPRLACGVIAAS